MDKVPPRIDLPSCPDGSGWVEFRDIEDLTGADVHALRRHISQADTGGETTNRVMVEAMKRMIVTWQVPYLADPRTPEANEAAWKKLRARDLQAIEGALEPVWNYLRPPQPADPGDDTPGSPTQPDSD